MKHKKKRKPAKRKVTPPIDLHRARVMKQLGLPANHPVDPRVKKAMKQHQAPKPPEEYVTTPHGIGMVLDKSLVPVYKKVETPMFDQKTGAIVNEFMHLYDRDPFVDVFLVGGTLESFTPKECKPATKAAYDAAMAARAAPPPRRVRRLAAGGPAAPKQAAPPTRTYHRVKNRATGLLGALLKRVPKAFTRADVEAAMFAEAQARHRAPVKNPTSRAHRLIRKMLKQNLVTEAAP